MFSKSAQTAGGTDRTQCQSAAPIGARLEPSRRAVSTTLAFDGISTSAVTHETAPSKIPSILVGAMAFIPSFLRSQTWELLGYAEADRRAFAVSRANVDPFKTLEQLPSLALSQESDRKDIASILRNKIPEELLASLGRIGIQDPQFTFEVAQAAVKQSVTSLYYPWWRPDQKLSARVGRMNLAEEQKLAILETVLQQRPHELPTYARSVRPELPASRFKLACMWAQSQAEHQNDRGSSERLFPLTKAWIPEEKLRAHVVKEAVGKAPHLLKLFSKASEVASPELLREITLRGASSPGYFDYKALQALGIQDPKSIIEILESGARTNPLLAVSQLKHFTLEDKTAMHNIVVTAADHLHHHHVDLRCFIDEVKQLRIEDRAVLQRVAHSLARVGWIDASGLSALGVTTRDEKFALTAIAANHCGPPTLARLTNLGLTDPLDTLRVIAQASARHPLAVMMKTKHDYSHLNASYKQAVYRTVIGQSPEGMAALLGARILPPQEVLSSIVAPALHAAQCVWAQDRGIYSVKVVENILDGLLNNAQALRLEPPEQPHGMAPLTKLNYILQELEAKFPELHLRAKGSTTEADALSRDAALLVSAAGIVTAPHATERDSIQRPLALVAGLDGLATEPLGPRDYRKVVELLRSIYEGQAVQHPNLGALLDIAPDVWKTDFAGGLECVLSRAALYSIDPSVLPERLTINRSNVTDQRRQIGAALTTALASRLGLSSDGDAVTLAKTWGDLTPITVLLARFTRSHAYEIPALRDVVDHVIKGTFSDYRYDTQRDQLRGFTPIMLKRWRENPHRLTLCRTSESSELSKDRALAGAQHNYAQLLLHLSQVAEIGDLKALGSVEQARALARSKQDVFAAHYRQMEKERSGSSLQHIIGSVGALLREGDREDASLFLRNFATIKARIGSHLPTELRQQLIDDLNAITEAVKERSVDKNKGYVIFTTVTDDPKLMMTVGDLVNTSSCQNFRTGSVVQTLLGYVMDGNIKASLSFAIAEGTLRNLFKIPHKQPLDPSRYTVSFEAPKLLLTLTDPEGQSHTISLGKAIRRRILRVGQREQDAQPAMFAERPYEILHAVTPQIEAEEGALLHQIEKKCGFRPAVGNVEFPASSNPAGVYSDHGLGAMMGDYMLNLSSG